VLATQSPSLDATQLFLTDVLKPFRKYLRHTIDRGILYWRQIECISYLPVISRPCLSTTKIYPTFRGSTLPDFPRFSKLLELVDYVDVSHATDLHTRRSVTGLSFCLAGGTIAFKSKLQPTVAASSTENECMVTMVATKIAQYLRSSLIEIGFPPSGLTLLYKDKKAAIDIVITHQTFSTHRDCLCSSTDAYNSTYFRLY
jgi:hypothetical protein